MGSITPREQGLAHETSTKNIGSHANRSEKERENQTNLQSMRGRGLSPLDLWRQMASAKQRLLSRLSSSSFSSVTTLFHCRSMQWLLSSYLPPLSPTLLCLSYIPLPVLLLCYAKYAFLLYYSFHIPHRLLGNHSLTQAELARMPFLCGR